MKSLIVEDEFTCREILQIQLSAYGPCVAAVNGLEAVEAVDQALTNQEPYDLICMDIRMPELDGIEALRRIRELEARHGIGGSDGVKVVMTTTCDQSRDIFSAFRSGCESYLIKPIERQRLRKELQKLGLLTGSELHRC